MSKPLLFLDIDGVMNNPGCYENFAKAMEKLSMEEAKRRSGDDVNVELLLASECVAILNEITDAVDAEIVLSSSWRHLYHDKHDRFYALMNRIGVKAPVVGFTPTLRGDRGDEIVHWLRANRKEANIVVLDDDDDMNAVEPWFVQTNGAVGLTSADRDRALRVLQGKAWKREQRKGRK